MNEQGRGDANGRREDEGSTPHLGDPREPSPHPDDSAAPDLPAPAAPGDADAADALDRLRAADPAAGSEPHVAGIEADLRRRIGQFGEEPSASDGERELDALASRPFGSPLAGAPGDVAGDPEPGDEGTSESAVVASFAERRDRRGRPAGAWLAAAAAVAIAAGGGGYLLGSAGADWPTLSSADEEAEGPHGDGADSGQGESDLDGDANRMTDDNGQGSATANASEEAAAPDSAAETYAQDTEESLSTADAEPDPLPFMLSNSGPSDGSALISPPPVYAWAGEESLPTTPETESGGLTRLAPVVQTDEEFAALAERLGLSDNSLAGEPGWEALVDPADPASGRLTVSDDGQFDYSITPENGSPATAENAIAAAESFGEQIGLPADTAWNEAGAVDDDVLLNGDPATSADPLLASTWGPWTVQVGPTGEVTRATGRLVDEEAVPPEPIISPAQALDRLNDPEFGAALATTRNPASSFMGDGGVPWADAGTRSTTVDPPLTWDRPVLDLTEYSLTTSTYVAADGSLYVVPAYEFSNATAVAPVIALTDDTLGLD